MSEMHIKEIIGRQVWDSRGRPALEVEVITLSGVSGSAIAPAGASTGSGEALELRDGGTRFGGFGVEKALHNVKQKIAPALQGKSLDNLLALDELMIALDGSKQKTNLGANATIATSMALAHAAANSLNLPLWKLLRNQETQTDEKILLPVPEVQIFGGGAHAQGSMDLQDFMIMPFGAKSFREAMEWVAEIYLAAGSIMKRKGKLFGVADEGGYWPAFDSNQEALAALLQAIEQAGFNAETQVGISLDIAATQIYKEGGYLLKAEKRILNNEQWFQQITTWLNNYPICAIEDPFVEHDLESHARLLLAIEKLSRKVQLVGDDLLVTNLHNIEKANRAKACNTLLCKPNQIGTLSEAKAAYQQAKRNGWATIVSARSGESEDTTICHLALGWGIKQIKVGSFTRSERMAKWNELLRLEERVGAAGIYAGAQIFSQTGKNNVA